MTLRPAYIVTIIERYTGYTVKYPVDSLSRAIQLCKEKYTEEYVLSVKAESTFDNSIYYNKNKESDQQAYQLRDQLADLLPYQVRDQLRKQIVDQMRDQLRDQRRYQLRDQRRYQLRDQRSNQLRYQLLYQTKD